MGVLKESSTHQPILIAGGGVAGLATALALAQRGRSVHVLERRSDQDEAGAGVQLGPNAVKALRALGVADLLEPSAVAPSALIVRSATSARVIVRMPLEPHMIGRFGAPYWTVLRQDLMAALAARVAITPGIVVERDWRVASVSETAGDVTLQAVDGRRVQGAAAIAADGLWSTVRAQLAPAQRPRYAGRSAWRAVLAPEGLPALFGERAVCLWLGAGGHVVHYPVDRMRRVNIVLVAKHDVRSDEWNDSGDQAELRRCFTGWPEPIRLAIEGAREWRRWSLTTAPQLARWHFGRVLLIGDAAHPVLPFLAQGAGLALEDAVAVGTAIGTVTESESQLLAAFAAVSAARSRRAARVAHASLRNRQLYHLAGPAAWTRDRAMQLVGGERLLRAYDWLYGYQP